MSPRASVDPVSRFSGVEAVGCGVTPLVGDLDHVSLGIVGEYSSVVPSALMTVVTRSWLSY